MQIYSISRRTDVPACLSEEFMESQFPHLCKDGFLVFWTKNFTSMMKYLPALEEKFGNKFYIQYTITSYGKGMESNIPHKGNIIIPNFQELSNRLGKNRVVWRYDPILFTDFYNMEYHKKWFPYMIERLAEYTDTCVTSFIDVYGKIRNKGFIPCSATQQTELLMFMLNECKKYNITLATCAEAFHLDGVQKSHCIDANRINAILGKEEFTNIKDPTQRKECGCIRSVDIGQYHTCTNGCKYCYAQ